MIRPIANALLRDVRQRAEAKHLRAVASRCDAFLTSYPKCGRTWLRYLLRSEEHTSELQSLMRISYAVFCLKKKNTTIHTHITVMSPTYNRQLNNNYDQV